MGKIREELISLAHANMFQLTHRNKKNEWLIRKNITNEELFKFPSHFNEQEMFLILNFARKFELIAFNTGINFEKKKSQEFLNNIIKDNNNKLSIARGENERLSAKLMQLIGEQE